MKKQLLIIDDDRLFSDAVATHLESENIGVHVAYNKKEGLLYCRNNRVDVVLLDQNLPDGKGIELCPDIIESCEQTKIIFITAFPSFDHAVEALRQGAYDYLSKPLALEELEMTINQSFRTVELERVEQVHKFKTRKESEQTVMVGLDDGGTNSIQQIVQLAATHEAPVLITGETGTGKNVVAKSIHYLASSNGAPFIGINCAALPENLIEAELFGYEKGAFTGAMTAKKGIFEMADGGTLFLDEIGELPMHLQAKLLGVLDDGTVRRLGGGTSHKVKVRTLAATNRDLELALENKEFREDLYYRLSVMRIHIPPLRERSGDIPRLCNYFLSTLSPDKKLVIEKRELDALGAYHWPGNVRELRNIIERSIILRKDRVISPAVLIKSPGSTAKNSEKSYSIPERNSDKLLTLAEWEKIHIINTLSSCDQNHTHTAKALDISRSTLIRKMNRFCIKTSVSK